MSIELLSDALILTQHADHVLDESATRFVHSDKVKQVSEGDAEDSGGVWNVFRVLIRRDSLGIAGEPAKLPLLFVRGLLNFLTHNQ